MEDPRGRKALLVAGAFEAAPRLAVMVAAHINPFDFVHRSKRIGRTHRLPLVALVTKHSYQPGLVQYGLLCVPVQGDPAVIVEPWAVLLGD
jgi:hypothetical protein